MLLTDLIMLVDEIIIILWHISSKSGVWNQQRELLLGNSSVYRRPLLGNGLMTVTKSKQKSYRGNNISGCKECLLSDRAAETMIIDVNTSMRKGHSEIFGNEKV
jgi:hypothetical protein